MSDKWTVHLESTWTVHLESTWTVHLDRPPGPSTWMRPDCAVIRRLLMPSTHVRPSMLPQPHDIRLSLKRSRGRERILEYVVRRGDAYLQEIAQDLGMTEARVRAAIHGAPPEYRVELSLVGLRLLEYRKGRTLPYYVATPLGKDAQALRRKRHAR